MSNAVAELAKIIYGSLQRKRGDQILLLADNPARFILRKACQSACYLYDSRDYVGVFNASTSRCVIERQLIFQSELIA